MSEVTWLMVLGAIAIITPIVLISIHEYTSTEVFDARDQLIEEYGLYFNETEYDLINSTTCANVYDENELGMTNYALLDENRFIYFYPEEQNWIYSPNIDIACRVRDDYITYKLNQTLLTENETLQFFDESLEVELSDENLTTNRRTRNLIGKINPNRFFNSLNELPQSIKFFIIAFYSLFFTYLGIRVVTLL